MSAPGAGDAPEGASREPATDPELPGTGSGPPPPKPEVSAPSWPSWPPPDIDAVYRTATEIPRILAVLALAGMLAAGGVDLAVVQIGTAPLGCQSSATFPPWGTATLVLLPLVPVVLASISLVGHLRARRTNEIRWGRRLRGAIELPVVAVVLTTVGALATWFFALLAVGLSTICF